MDAAGQREEGNSLQGIELFLEISLGRTQQSSLISLQECDGLLQLGSAQAVKKGARRPPFKGQG